MTQQLSSLVLPSADVSGVSSTVSLVILGDVQPVSTTGAILWQPTVHLWIQSMSHVINDCLVRKFEGGIAKGKKPIWTEQWLRQNWGNTYLYSICSLIMLTLVANELYKHFWSLILVIFKITEYMYEIILWAKRTDLMLLLLILVGLFFLLVFLFLSRRPSSKDLRLRRIESDSYEICRALRQEMHTSFH